MNTLHTYYFGFQKKFKGFSMIFIGCIRVQRICWAQPNWLTAFSPFPTIFSKGFFTRIIKARDLLVKDFNPFPNMPWFLHVSSTSLLKTLWEKEDLLVKSNSPFSHSVFYSFGELSAIFTKFEIVVCKHFQFGSVKKLSFGKGKFDKSNRVILHCSVIAKKSQYKLVLT